MSFPLKKPRAVFPEEDYVEEDEGDEDDMIDRTIDVNFEGYHAEDSDYHGIKQLLQQSLRGLNVDVGGLADVIISQNYVGSVIKQLFDDDDEETDEEDINQVYGVTTVINLTSRRDEDCVTTLRSAILEKCFESSPDSTSQMLRELLGNESKHVGLLISERLVNLPPQFALPAFESLLKEIEKAKKKKMPYDFSHFILISKVYKEKQKKRKGQKPKENNPATEMLANPEEETFEEECTVSFEYSVEGEPGLGGKWEEEDAQYIPWRRVLLFPATKLPSILSKVKELM